MKKNLLYLWALVCSLTLFAACSSDDDDSDNKNNENPPEEEAVITAPDVIGTYWGNLDMSMIPDGSDQEIVIGDGIEKFITLSQVSNTEVKIELKDFELFINQQKQQNFTLFHFRSPLFLFSQNEYSSAFFFPIVIFQGFSSPIRQFFKPKRNS